MFRIIFGIVALFAVIVFSSVQVLSKKRKIGNENWRPRVSCSCDKPRKNIEILRRKKAPEAGGCATGDGGDMGFGIV